MRTPEAEIRRARSFLRGNAYGRCSWRRDGSYPGIVSRGQPFLCPIRCIPGNLVLPRVLLHQRGFDLRQQRLAQA